ncbi:DUF6063 family protein [Erysipelotrichaceae bacterium 66-17]
MKASEIFYELLKQKQFSSSSEEYAAILDDEKVEKELNEMVEAFECELIYASKGCYLIPKSDNVFLGFSKTQLKDKLTFGSQRLVHYYISMYALLILLNEFYGTEYSTAHKRDFLKVGDWMNRVKDSLVKGAEMEHNETNISFKEMYNAYNHMRSGMDSKASDNQYSIFYRLILLLEEQDLIDFVEENDSVYCLPRLDALMDQILTSDAGYETVMNMVKGLEYAKTK